MERYFVPCAGDAIDNDDSFINTEACTSDNEIVSNPKITEGYEHSYDQHDIISCMHNNSMSSHSQKSKEDVNFVDNVVDAVQGSSTPTCTMPSYSTQIPPTKPQQIMKACRDFQQLRSPRSPLYLQDDYTPLPDDPGLNYSFDYDGDATLKSYPCPDNFREMMVIVAEVRRLRLISSGSFNYVPPLLSSHTMNFPYNTPTHLPRKLRSNQYEFME